MAYDYHLDQCTTAAAKSTIEFLNNATADVTDPEYTFVEGFIEGWIAAINFLHQKPVPPTN